MRFLISLLVNGLFVYLLGYVFSGIYVSGYVEAILVALLLAVINFFVRPIITILTLPITILTLGLFLFVINGAMVLIVDSLMKGFSVDGWLWAIIFSILMSVLGLIFGDVGKK